VVTVVDLMLIAWGLVTFIVLHCLQIFLPIAFAAAYQKVRCCHLVTCRVYSTAGRDQPFYKIQDIKWKMEMLPGLFSHTVVKSYQEISCILEKTHMTITFPFVNTSGFLLHRNRCKNGPLG